MKNDNFHTFFSLSWLQILNLPALLQNKNTQIGPFPWNYELFVLGKARVSRGFAKLKEDFGLADSAVSKAFLKDCLI